MIHIRCISVFKNMSISNLTFFLNKSFYPIWFIQVNKQITIGITSSDPGSKTGRLRAGAALGVGAPPRFSSVRPKTRLKKHASYYTISKFENNNFFTKPL